MTITINDKTYDETKLDAKVRNSIVQVNNYQSRLNTLVADVENCKLILLHPVRWSQLDCNQLLLLLPYQSLLQQLGLFHGPNRKHHR